MWQDQRKRRGNRCGTRYRGMLSRDLEQARRRELTTLRGTYYGAPVRPYARALFRVAERSGPPEARITTAVEARCQPRRVR